MQDHSHLQALRLIGMNGVAITNSNFLMAFVILIAIRESLFPVCFVTLHFAITK